MTAVTHTLDEVRSRVLEERDREQRASNIIMYNIAEPAGVSREDKWRWDRQFCMDLFNKVLGVSIVENDMKRFLRLGKSRDSAESPRPVQFRDRVLKNMIMESLSKLKDAELKYKQVIFAHDMTREEREECKRLVAEVNPLVPELFYVLPSK